MSNVHEYNNVTVSIKVQQSTFRLEKGTYGYTTERQVARFHQLNTLMLDSDITVEGLP